MKKLAFWILVLALAAPLSAQSTSWIWPSKTRRIAIAGQGFHQHGFEIHQGERVHFRRTPAAGGPDAVED